MNRSQIMMTTFEDCKACDKIRGPGENIQELKLTHYMCEARRLGKELEEAQKLLDFIRDQCAVSYNDRDIGSMLTLKALAEAYQK